MIQGLLPLCPLVTMYATALDGALGCGSLTEMKKNFLPAVPQRDQKSGVLRIGNDFHGSGVNQSDSYQILQSRHMC